VQAAPVPFRPLREQPLLFVVPSRIDPAGVRGPTRHQARRGRWVRVGPNLYLPADVLRERPEQRAVELATRYPRAAISGWGSLWFHGAAFFDGKGPDGATPLPLVVALGPERGCRRSESVLLTYEPRRYDDVAVVQGVVVTTPVRALFDEARRAPGWREAVVTIDMALAAGLVSLGDVTAYAGARRRWRHAGRVLDALSHCSARSESPNETRLRLVWTVDAKLPPPLVNHDLLDRAGRFVCRPDLLDPVAGLVGEYDGADHRSAERHSRDVRREERCRELGLEYVTVTALDMLQPDLVAARILSARARSRFAPLAGRAWRLRAE
jgi:hypothetical protein